MSVVPGITNNQVMGEIFPFSDIVDIPDNKKLKVLSLFSGCGGMDLGFEGGFNVHTKSLNSRDYSRLVEKEVGDDWVKLKPTLFHTVFANDILSEAQKAWANHFGKQNHSSLVYHTESIVDLVKRHRKGDYVFPSNIDVLTGGFPCQDFSLSGKRNGLNSHRDHSGKIIDPDLPTIESRGQLYYWMREVISITLPKIFIAENVKGLVNLGDVRDVIQNDFSQANNQGYIVLKPRVLHAADYGVPQSRERIIFIGIRKDVLKDEAYNALLSDVIPPEFDPYPPRTHAFTRKLKGLEKPQTVCNVLKHLDEPSDSNDESQKYYSKAKFRGKRCQGQTEVNWNGLGPTIRSEHHGNIEYRRLSQEHGGKIKEEIEKGLMERRLTPRECALIQTFPPDYEFVIPSKRGSSRFFISPSSAYKIIGNAVPPLLGYHIACRLQELWTKYFD